MIRLEDYIDKSRGVATVAALGRLYSDVVRAEGYENCVLTSLRGRRIDRVAWAEIPEGYYDAYMRGRWDRIDPVVARSLRAALPFFWNDVFEQTKLSEAQVQFIEECKSLKVQSGIVFPLHGPGRHVDIMSISRRTAEPADRSQARLLHAISVQTWARFVELSGDTLQPAMPGTALTARELEILRWCKDGKTRPEIGDILSISTKTVEFHLKNIMDKLGATNQITAVVIALQCGLIEM